MTLLAWDTATAATAVAFGDVELRHDPAPGERPGHTRELLPLVVRALAEAGAEWGDVTGIAVGLGPGSFTGLRIGISTANALAQARSLPLTGVSSLRALAAGAGSGAGIVAAAVDARRGEVFLAVWRGEDELVAPLALPPGELAALLAALPGRPVALGDGALRYRAAFEAAGADVPGDDAPGHLVRAREVARLARGRSAAPGNAVRPEYIRSPDAVPVSARREPA
jgi:tRNA threonylcarbamoyladenosine biosynthesis protein TsaB